MQETIVHRLIRTHGSKFARFIVCGGLGACIDFGSLNFLIDIAHWEAKYALLVSKGGALIFVFLSNRFFTFRGHVGDPRSQMMRFVVVYFSAATLNYAVSLSLITIGLPYNLANALAIGTLMFFNFFFLNSFVFKQAPVLADEVVAV